MSKGPMGQTHKNRGNEFPTTTEGWEEAKREWIIEYAKDHKAKDDAIISAWTATTNYMKPKETNIEDHSDRIDTICTYIDLLPGNHNTLMDLERKSLLFNTFPKTWRAAEFMLNCNDPELASEKEIKDFMEKKKEITDRENSVREKAKSKVKKMEESKKKRDEKKGNQPCRTHNGAHLWKDDCPARGVLPAGRPKRDIRCARVLFSTTLNGCGTQILLLIQPLNR